MSIDSWVALREKVPNVLSRCHTKRVWYDTDFSKKKKNQKNFFFFSNKSKKSVSYQKKGGLGPVRPSFFWYDNDSEY